LPVPRADTATSGATPSDTAASGASAAGFFTAGATASDASGTVDQGGSEPPRPRRDDEPGAASARGPAWARDQETP
jgi:hypothetical protein